VSRLVTSTLADEEWLSRLEAIERDFPEWVNAADPLDEDRECDCGMCHLCDPSDPGGRR